jgi:hypothetical protein
MPTNTHTESCIRSERGTLVFTAPVSGRLLYGSRAQIIDVFALQVATGYTRDPQGRLLLEAQPSVVAGGRWSLAKAAELISNDVPTPPLGCTRAKQAGVGAVLGWWRAAALP